MGLNVSSSSSQEHVQISGNSSLTNRHAPASSKGPSVIPTPTRVSTSESRSQLMRSPQEYPSARVFQTSSVHLSHPHRNGASSDWESIGEDVGETVGDLVGDFVGRREGETVGLAVSSSSLSLSPLSSSSSQEQVQISGNSSLTNKHAPSSSKGPLVIPTSSRADTSESLKKLMRSPQVKPSASVFQTFSVHLSHPQRGELGVGAGACTGDGTTPPFVLKTTLGPYVL